MRSELRYALMTALIASLGCSSNTGYRTCDGGTNSAAGGSGSAGAGGGGQNQLDGGAGSTGDCTWTAPTAADDGINYYLDNLDTHPGCSVEGLPYPAANIPGYRCAAKEYLGTEDTSKPIVLLIHGNSDSPLEWEKFSTDECGDKGPTQGLDMLAERLISAGYRSYAVDLRTDRVPLFGECIDDLTKCNQSLNSDHGWGTPIVQHFIKSTMEAFPDRRFAIMGFSLGATLVRDAMRRLFVKEGYPVWSRMDHVLVLAAANHGVSTYGLCQTNPTMRGRVTCEMGDRAAYSPTPFLTPLNGPGGAYEAPCADANTAYGSTGACCGNTVHTTPLVMKDVEDGTQKDPFVSEVSSGLKGAENLTVGLEDYDTSDYFYCGMLANHYGSIRSVAAMNIIMSKLAQ